jgi:hypothetical protein
MHYNLAGPKKSPRFILGSAKRYPNGKIAVFKTAKIHKVPSQSQKSQFFYLLSLLSALDS